MVMSPALLASSGDKHVYHDLDSIRQQCALRLQRRLQDPYVRADQSVQPSSLFADVEVPPGGTAGHHSSHLASFSPPPRDDLAKFERPSSATSSTVSGAAASSNAGTGSAAHVRPSPGSATRAQSDSGSGHPRRHPAVPCLPLHSALPANTNVCKPPPARPASKREAPMRSAAVGAPQLATAARVRSPPRNSGSGPSSEGSRAVQASSATARQAFAHSPSGRSMPWERSPGARSASASGSVGPATAPAPTRKAATGTTSYQASSSHSRSRPSTRVVQSNARCYAPTAASLARQSETTASKRGSSPGIGRPAAAKPAPSAAASRSHSRQASPLRRPHAPPDGAETRNGLPSNPKSSSRPVSPFARGGGGGRKAEQCNSVSDQLQKAAQALRCIVPAAPRSSQPGRPVSQTSVESTKAGTPSVSVSHLSPIKDRNGTHSSPSRMSAESGLSGFLDDPTIQRLVLENASLQDAVNEANHRLSRLEDEKWQFYDEGVFDLVNSMCGQSGSKPQPPRSKPGQATASSLAGNAQQRKRSGSSPPTCRAPQNAPLHVALSPHSADGVSPLMSLSVRRGEEEERSSKLSDENEELRRELAKVREMGQALEQQAQAAEDDMHSLEQQEAMLVQRLAMCQASQRLLRTSEQPMETALDDVSSSLAPRVGSEAAGGTCGAEHEAALRRQMEDMNRAFRTELEEEQARVREISEDARARELAQKEIQLKLDCFEASAAQRLREETALERQLQEFEARARSLAEENRLLHDSEARAAQLAEENSRLQAALATAPPHDNALAEEEEEVAVDSAEAYGAEEDEQGLQDADVVHDEAELLPLDLAEAW
eukprot:TRINITY_DN14334_c0_g1_i1.p1 TRINITY_DN14334_c0_g1~~TRINITY_DN14334_c0_g1_i1.p1  ORF type:complete len:832 (-),score=164.19 TRINITY_DN14334_c0_g1_i1:115-2610(-)